MMYDFIVCSLIDGIHILNMSHPHGLLFAGKTGCHLVHTVFNVMYSVHTQKYTSEMRTAGGDIRSGRAPSELHWETCSR